jgi:hypothetical protein
MALRGCREVDAWNDFFASMSGDYGTVPRALRSPFVARWLHRHCEAKAEEEALRHAVATPMRRSRASPGFSATPSNGDGADRRWRLHNCREAPELAPRAQRVC